MDERVRAFLETNHAAVMVTLKPDGTPHAVRVGVGLVDGKLWSSGTRSRVRTGHLRRDDRCTLFVMSENPYVWATLETSVTILNGADAPMQNLALYRALAGEPDDVDEYLEAMVNDGRLVYEFTVHHAYGQF